MNIIITGLSIDGHSVPVPNGLSDLVNAAGAWKIREENNKPSILGQFDSHTFRRDGQLVTRLTLKKD